MSATRVLHERHECDRVNNFDFDSDIFSHPYIYYMERERPQGEE